MSPPETDLMEAPIAQAGGVAKTDLAFAFVRKVNRNSAIATVCGDLCDQTPCVLKDVDAAIFALDSHQARLQGTRLAMASRTPSVDLAADASMFQVKASVSDPSRPSASNSGSCTVCPWAPRALAMAGEDTGVPCAGLSPDTAYASSSTAGQRAATLGVREALAMTDVIDLEPSLGREVRDDMASYQIQRYAVPADPESCAGLHALGVGELEPLDLEPQEITLTALARACDFASDDEIVLASRDVVETAMCVECLAPSFSYRRAGAIPAKCRKCAAEMAEVRRSRRLRWGTAARWLGETLASEWFGPGDHFAVVGARGTRNFVFPSHPPVWQAGEPWDERADAARFVRLPKNYRLDQIRRTRLAIVGLGHVGSAVLHQIAALPWAGLLLLDRDHFEPHNAPAYAFAPLVAESPGRVAANTAKDCPL